MRLIDATRAYVSSKQAIGMSFETDGRILAAFTKHTGANTLVANVAPEAVREYLKGKGEATRFWHHKHEALSGFWIYAIQHGYTDRSPLPPRRPKIAVPFVPYIYSRRELRHLLDGTFTYQKRSRKLEPNSFRTVLLLLYGAGLRVSEALHLTCGDVNLQEATLTICRTKFYKTRCIAVSSQLCHVLAVYDLDRQRAGHNRGETRPFFTYANGHQVARGVVEDAFLRLRSHVGVGRDNARYQPRIHDLRHTFAVHRLVAWYRAGADVQRLLPGLATHLGHSDLSSTQWYLTMTPELLAEASLKFEQYVGEASDGSL